MPHRDIPEPPASFALDRERLAFIVLKAKAFDALVASDNPSDASDAIDDRFVDALEDEADNPTRRELAAAIAGLNVDAQASLVALAWLGRGDSDEWEETLALARERSGQSTVRYLLGLPLLGDYLEEGASKIGISIIDEEIAGMADPDVDTRGAP